DRAALVARLAVSVRAPQFRVRGHACCPLRPVAVECRARKQHQGHRRRHRHEYRDQQLVQDKTRAKGREEYDGGERHRAGSPARSQSWCVHPLVEAAEAERADGAGKRQRGACKQQCGGEKGRPDGQVGGVAHSITSPRMRNFASATLETKPNTPMISAASKYTSLPVRMPTVSASSMAQTYIASRLSTRSCARGPRTTRKA